MELPPQLLTDEHRFILVHQRDKKPFEKAWQTTNNYAHDNKKIQGWLSQNNNYGVLGGYGKLLIIDFDNMDVYNNTKDVLPPTFSVRTGSGKIHLYYHCDQPENIKILDKNKNTLVDVQGKGKQVIGAGSTHPNGNTYQVQDDIPIADITINKIREVFTPYLQPKKTFTPFYREDAVTTNIKEHTPLLPLMNEYGYDTSRNPTMCRLGHESKGQACFSYDNSQNLWYCHHCDKGGDIFSFIMEHDHTDFTTTKNKLAKKANIPTTINEKNKKEKDYLIKTSFIEIENTLLAEQVYNPKTQKSSYAIWDGQNVTYQDKIFYQGITYEPITDEEVQKQCIILPEQAQEYTSTEHLIKKIQVYIYKYLDVTEQFLTIASYYPLLSFVYDRVNTINYIRFLGDTGTGKTRGQDTIGGICYKPIVMAGAASPAPIFRILGKWKGTLVMEEADMNKSDENNDIIKIFNCGFERGKPVIRCRRNEPDKIEFHEVYSPKVFGMRKPFDDKATESRCISETMAQTRRIDIPDVLPQAFYVERAELQNQLLMWRFRNYYKINVDEGLSIDLGNIEPRLKQASRAYATVLAHDSVMLNRFRTYLLQYNEELRELRSETPDGQVVNALANLIADGHQYICSQDIATYLADRGINVRATSRSVGARLKSLKFGIKVQRVNGVVRRTVVWGEDGVGVFLRYVVDEDVLEKVRNVTSVTCVTSVTETQGGAKTLKNVTSVTSNLEQQNININNNSTLTTPHPSLSAKQRNNVTDVTSYIKPVTSAVTSEEKVTTKCVLCDLTNAEEYFNHPKGMICDLCHTNQLEKQEIIKTFNKKLKNDKNVDYIHFMAHYPEEVHAWFLGIIQEKLHNGELMQIENNIIRAVFTTEL